VNFFARQEATRRQSRWLVIAFLLSVLLVVAAIDFVMLLVFSGMRDAPPPLAVLVMTSLLVIGFIGCASFYKALRLRGGGGVVALQMGGVRVDRSTQDPLKRRLLNVVEEMAIASGVPGPEVYVLDQENAINAFAAGHTPANAAIAVTRGALQRLNREQLQGVIAHEFSHILNGDMRLSIRLMGLVFGLLAMALVARTLLRFSRVTDKKAAPVIAVVFAVMIIGYVGLFCGRFIQAWISRKRESLADASAVQFTRNPEGLKAALLRAAAQGRAIGFVGADTEEVAHMLFLSANRRAFSTHPSLLERLQEIDPHLTKEEFNESVRKLQIEMDRERSTPQQDETTSPAPAAGGIGALGKLGVAVPVLLAATGGDGIAASAGDPQTEHIEHARQLRAALPEVLEDFGSSAERARSLMCALLLSREAAVGERQLVFIARELGEPEAAAVRDALPVAQALAPELRLPAVLQLFPTLRQFPLEQRQQLLALLQLLARCDARIDVFEFALAKLVATSMQDQQDPRPPHGNDSLEDRAADMGVAFAVLAHHGATDEVAARQAYEAGLAPLLPRQRPDYAVPADWAAGFDAALDRLAALRPLAKELLIEGLVRTIAHDDRLTVEEAELLRTVCAVLQCPLPPVLPT
jgi:Zn-dependent protease with chaperone function